MLFVMLSPYTEIIFMWSFLHISYHIKRKAPKKFIINETMQANTMSHLHELIEQHFKLSLSHGDILCLLRTIYVLTIAFVLWGGVWDAWDGTVEEWIQHNWCCAIPHSLISLRERRRLLGYKLQHLSCIQAGYVVAQNKVGNLLKMHKNMWN